MTLLSPEPPPARCRLGPVRRGRQLLVRPAARRDRRAGRDARRPRRAALSDRRREPRSAPRHAPVAPVGARRRDDPRGAPRRPRRHGVPHRAPPRRRAPESGAARWRRAIPRPGFGATATPWASSPPSPRPRAPRGWSSAVSSRRSTARSSVGGPSSSACAALFSGKLVYSANWDHYRDARLFELVDEDGITGYFNLRDASEPADDAPRSRPAGGACGARSRLGRLGGRAASSSPSSATARARAARRSRGTKKGAARPTSRSSGAASPPSDGRGPVPRALDGVYVWNWYGWGGPGTTGYTPRGKPAELEVRQLLQDL